VKKVEAIIRPETLPEVRRALEDIGYSALTTTSVHGHGVERGTTRQWVGMAYIVDLLPMTKVEVLVSDTLLERALAVIREHARTGAIGDGKIIVTSVEQVVSVLTGEHATA
jgi:nitrogen regulatory protein P-II 1